MLFRKYIAVFLLATFSLVACDNGGYDTRTGDAQTDADRGTAGTDTPMERDTDMGAPRERDMDTRTGSIRTRPGTDTGVESDTGMGPGTTTNPGTGAIPGGETSPDTGADTDNAAGGGTGNP